MIFTKCVVCGKACIIPETKEDEAERHPLMSLYWSYGDNKQMQPYCGVQCSLDDYQQNKRGNV